MAWSNSQWLTALHYAFQDSERLYLVMDFHPGGDLLTIIERQEGGMGEEDARFYLAEICAGLADLHRLGFVHRDVKPENVLITRSGHIKLVDFGSAARLDGRGKVVSGREGEKAVTTVIYDEIRTTCTLIVPCTCTCTCMSISSYAVALTKIMFVRIHVYTHVFHYSQLLFRLVVFIKLAPHSSSLSFSLSPSSSLLPCHLSSFSPPLTLSLSTSLPPLSLRRPSLACPWVLPSTLPLRCSPAWTRRQSMASAVTGGHWASLPTSSCTMSHRSRQTPLLGPMATS